MAEESDSSSSGNSLGQILMKYRKKVREDRISNRLSIESPQNSNINININMPSTSGTPSISVSLGSVVSPKQVKNITSHKETQKKNNKHKNKMHKPNTSKSNNTPNSSKNEKNKTDPEYVAKNRRNYFKLSSTELTSIASRVRFYHETGIVLSDEEDVTPCQNKYKRKKKTNNEPKQRGPQVCGTTYGQGRVGTTLSGFGVRRCACCNVNKDNCTSHNLPERQTPVCFSEVMEGMSEHTRNQFKQREERFLQVQQRDLLQHPELVDGGYCEVTVPVPPAELLQDKRQWIEKFIDSMSVDRVDYEKPKQLNIVEGISHKRPSDVHFRNEEEVAVSSDAKTIVQRVDFRKEKERERQSRIDTWLKSNAIRSFCSHELNATSTPRQFKLPPEMPAVNLQDQNVCTNQIPSTSRATDMCLPDSTSNDAVKDCSLGNSAMLEDPNILTSTRIGSILDEYSSDFSHLDRSNVTIRTPQSKHRKEIGHISIPSSSKPKVTMSQNDIMNLVDSLVAAEEDSINQEAHERCERMLKTAERTRTVLHDALDEILITSDNSPDRYDHVLDNSIEIIGDPDLRNINPMVVNDSVQVIDSDEEVIPTVNLIDSFDTPSTSRPIRTIRRKRALQTSPARVSKKRNKNRTATTLPSISEVAPSATSTEPVGLVNSENKSSTRSLRDCPICLESLAGKDISSTICGHVFCTPCITAAVRARRACPNCRTSLTLKKIHPLFI